MNKLILALTLMLGSFFAHSVNIFTDGDVFIEPAEQVQFYGVRIAGDVDYYWAETLADAYNAACNAYTSTLATSGGGGTITYSYSCNGTAIYDIHKHTETWNVYSQTYEVYDSYYTSTMQSNEDTKDQKSCPPDDFPTYTFPVFIDGEIIGCSDPFQILQVDDCGSSENTQFLNVQVTSPSGCYTQDDGSICKYDAQTDTSGNQYYSLDYEGNCYGSDEDIPSLDDNGDLGQLPPDDGETCTDTYCSADPAEECIDGVCNEGCGYVDVQFVCVDVPEPEPCTGDDCDTEPEPEPCTGDDCDTEPEPCTGDDCDTGTGTEPCTGDDCVASGGGDLDLSGVISAINEVNSSVEEMDKSLNETSKTRNTAPSDGVQAFYTSTYEDRGGLQGVVTERIDAFKQTEFVEFLSEFNPSLSGGSPTNYQMCFNLGIANFGCQSFEPDSRVFPAIKIFILITAGFLCRKIIFGG